MLAKPALGTDKAMFLDPDLHVVWKVYRLIRTRYADWADIKFWEGCKDGGMLTPETWMFSGGLDGETRRVASSTKRGSRLCESGREPCP